MFQHFLFNKLAEQATSLHGKNNDLHAKMTQITAMLADVEKDQLAFHKQSAAHLRDCERRVKEYMESLSPTVLVKTAPTFFHTNQQRQMSANPNIASPTPRTPTGQLKLTGNNPKWDRQNPHLLNGKLYSSHVPREQYRHYKCDHCDLYGHLRYDCLAYKCPVCQTNCGKKPKTWLKIIPTTVRPKGWEKFILKGGIPKKQLLRL